MNITELMKDIRLSKGGHTSPETGMCAMEMVAWLEGLPHSDAPECTCPVIAAYVRELNDGMTNDDRQKLIPYLPRLVGTVSSEHEMERAEYLGRAADIPVKLLLEHKGPLPEIAAHAARYIQGRAFDALDGVLAIGPQSPGFSKPVEQRIREFRELVS